MKRIMVVFGTRPEAIKMAPVIKQLLKFPDEFEVKVCVTAQHREMLDQVLEIFSIKPDVDLNLMMNSQSLSEVTTAIISGMSEILQSVNPAIVLVHGDTTTTFATSLASFYLNIPVGHVEAGLRSNEIRSPFPEEFNRRTVSSVAKFHFAPTSVSGRNLELEGIRKESIFITGNTVIDSLNDVVEHLKINSKVREGIFENLNNLLKFNWQMTQFVLITGHRRENFGESLIEICEAIQELAATNPNIHFVYPVHLNPNVKDIVFDKLDGIKNIHLLPPLDYLTFTMLLSHAYIVLTDSGGLQEEAPAMGKPLLLMREVTERPEGVAAGSARIVGTSRRKIIREVQLLIEDKDHYQAMSKAHNPYGTGNAAQLIVEALRTA